MAAMVSDTQKSERRRRRKKATSGRAQKRSRTLAGTPKFPIHPEKAAKAAKPEKKTAK